jgi:protein-tyrosine phosphatase
MQYAFVFALLGGACGFVGLTAIEPTHGFSLMFLSPAVSFLLLAVAYAGGGPAMLGKRADGGRRWWARALFAPYLLLTRFSFVLYKLLGRHTPTCEVAPNLFLGRRLTAVEAAPFTRAAVLDLAAEFSEARPFRTPNCYLSLPVLDATAPTPEQLNRAVEWVAQQLANRPVFVHCALGHGRSASVLIAYLLHTGTVATVRDGLRQVRQLRPGVGFSPSQRRALEEWWAARKPAGDA